MSEKLNVTIILYGYFSKNKTGEIFENNKTRFFHRDFMGEAEPRM